MPPSGDKKPLRTSATASRGTTERPLKTFKPGAKTSGSASQKSTGAGTKSKSSTSIPTASPVQPTPKLKGFSDVIRPLPGNLRFKKNKSEQEANQETSNKPSSSPTTVLPKPNAESSHKIDNALTPQNHPLSPTSSSPNASRKPHAKEKPAPVPAPNFTGESTPASSILENAKRHNTISAAAEKHESEAAALEKHRADRPQRNSNAALTGNGVKPGMAAAVANYSKPSAPAKKSKPAPDPSLNRVTSHGDSTTTTRKSEGGKPNTSSSLPSKSAPSALPPAKSTATKPKNRSNPVDPSFAFRELQSLQPLERNPSSSTVTTKKQKAVLNRSDASVPKQEVESEDDIPLAQTITKKKLSTVKVKASHTQGPSKQTQKTSRGAVEEVVATQGHKNRRTMKRHRDEVDEDQSTGRQQQPASASAPPATIAKSLHKSKSKTNTRSGRDTNLPDELAFSDNETLPLVVSKRSKAIRMTKKNKKRKLDVSAVVDGVSLEVKAEMIDPTPPSFVSEKNVLPIPSSSSAANLPALPTAIAKSQESISSVSPPAPTPRDNANPDPSNPADLQDSMMVVEVSQAPIATARPRPAKQNENENISPLAKKSSTGPNLEEFTEAHRSMVKPALKSARLPSFSKKRRVQPIPAETLVPEDSQIEVSPTTAPAPILDAAQDDMAMEVVEDASVGQPKDKSVSGGDPMPVDEVKKKSTKGIKKAGTSVRKRKSEVALGGDSIEGGTEKPVKKRRTKSNIPGVSEVAPVPSVSVVASPVASAGPEVPPGFLALTPTVDDKQAVFRQIAPPLPDRLNGTTPASSPKKRGRPPKTATKTDPATPTASSTPRRKKKSPVDVVKQEQPIVKVEGAGAPMFDENALVEAASAMVDAGARKPGPKAGLKKNQAFASSGHQDIRWTLPPAEVYASAIEEPTGLIRDEETRKPFVWTSSKEELTSAIPALSKPVNGVSWLNIRYPVVLIEEDSATGVLGLDEQAEEGKFCLKLVMTRDYVCPPELLETHTSSPLSAKAVSQTVPVAAQPIPTPAPTTLTTPVDARGVSPAPAAIKPGTSSHPGHDSNFIPFRPMPEFDGLGPPVPPPVTQDYSALFDDSRDVPPPPMEMYDGDGGGTTDEDALLDLQYPDEQEFTQARDNITTLTCVPSTLPSEPPGVAGSPTKTSLQTSCSFPSGGNTQGMAPNEPVPRHDQANLDRLASLLNNPALHVLEPEATQPTPALLADPQVPMGSSYKVPTHLPVELNAILQAYISSSPVILIGSREVIEQTLKVKVENEHGLAYLGFFRITGVEEEVLPHKPKKDPGIGYTTGRIQWRFSCEWVTSGQELKAYTVSGEEGGFKPWWTPLTKGKGRLVKKGQSCHNRHYAAWSKHPNHNVLHDSNQHWSLLPEYATAEHVDGTAFGVKDESLPAGWHCKICGKLNFQEMLRLRRCESSICKQRATPPQGYALTLGQIRDPMQRAQMSHPYNVYPASVVEAFVDQWEDSMQTFSYVSKADPAISVKHVFTGNMPTLQQEATKLFEDIQKTVPLAKARGSNSPYFEYRLEADKDDAPWKNAPPCLTLARDVMVYYGNTYGELDSPKIRKLSLSAWVSSGSKRAASPFSCVKHSIVVMFLGSEAIITLTPKSGLPDPQGTETSSREGLEIPSQSTGALPLQVENGDLKAMIEDISPSSAPVAAPREPDDTMIVDVGMQDAENTEMALLDGSGDGPLPVEPTSALDTSTPAPIPKKGKEKPSIIVTMVHGDVLVLSGDKFDYSIKRAGTGILMIGEQR